jgi:D-glycero-beta-D-manno-heptose 1-phosphate adenylyltransferase
MPRTFLNKIYPPEKLRERLDAVRTQLGPAKSRLVFTNGVFDILHPGHVTYLAEARAKGDFLIVALNSDESAKRLEKGEGRPYNTLENRMTVVAALESVDLVTWFEEDTPIKVIGLCWPDILVKGGDWKEDAIVGAEQVRAHGGSVFSIPFEWATSTSALVERIKRKP